MKSGAGDDPFAEESSDEEDAVGPTDDADAVDEEITTDGDEHTPTHNDPAPATDTTADGGSHVAEEASNDVEDAGSNGERSAPDKLDIPWVLRRGSVKDDRPNVTQFFLRDETDNAERRFKSEVETALDTDVYTLDLREAAYLVAMRHSDEVAEQLRTWGYDYLD